MKNLLTIAAVLGVTLSAPTFAAEVDHEFDYSVKHTIAFNSQVAGDPSIGEPDTANTPDDPDGDVGGGPAGNAPGDGADGDGGGGSGSGGDGSGSY